MAPANPAAHQPANDDSTSTGTTGRLWFHLDDVVPLAVHAASTPSCGLTSAQLLARAPLTPALIWEGTSDGDRLTSNGQPGWFDADGKTHAARGRTWVDPEYGTVAAAVGEVGYLPVRGLPGSTFHLVEWLQQAAADGAHWLSLDLTRRRPVIGPSQLAVSDQRGDLYPPAATWVEASVACVPATGSGLYRALVAAGHYSNHGGLLARFDRDTADRMVDDLQRARAHQPGFHAVLRWAGEHIEIYTENADGPSGLRRYDVVGPDPDGLYPIGAYLWPWLPMGDS
ncbi:hypothetical protein OHA21_38370 [Actinoplanes sp. NBC_00393]|uniref:hypothetical protein n=1 Tax=Actinoplanes sp. NBC_00393 TaxID=2975953 RepID=UPI002E1B3AEB